MAEGLLPPAVAEFIADASEWITGIDEMIAANDRLLESIAKVDAAAKDSTMAGSAGGAAAGAEAAAANTEAAGAAGAAAAADRDLAAAEASAATYAERMAAMQAEVVTAAGEAADAQLRVADAAKAAGVGSDTYTVALDESTAASLRLMDAQIRLGQAELAAAGHADEAAAAQDVAGTETEVAGRKAKTSTGHFKLLALGLAVGAAASIKMAGDFQQSMTRLITSAGETQKNIGMVSKGILNLSVSTNTSTTQLAKGMYYVESAGFHGAQGLTVLKAAAEGAQAEGAQLATVSNAVTSALNSYGLKASSAMTITDEMVTAVGRGKMTMQDFSGALAAVLPVAAAAHIGFAQVAGGLATMTSQGMSAQWAAQDLRHTIVALQNPNNVQIHQMQQMGVNSVSLAKNIGKQGLTGTINILENAILKGMGKSGLVLLKSFNQSKLAAKSAQEEINAMPPSIKKVAEAYSEGKISAAAWQKIVYKGGESTLMKNLLQQFATTENAAKGFNTQLRAGGGNAQTFTAALSKMMGGQVGLQTALMVGGGHMATFKANVDAISKSAKATGANVNNWGLIQKNFNFQLGQAGKAAQAVGISFGSALLPAATKAMHMFSSFASTVAKNSIASKTLAIVIGTLLAGALTHQLVKGISAGVRGFQDIYTGGGRMLGFFMKGEKESSKFGLMMSKMGSMASTAWSGITAAASGIGSMFSAAASGIGTAAAAVRGWTIWSKIAAGATKAWSAAMFLLDSVMALNPVVLIIAGIIALVAVFVILWVKCAAFRNFWKAVWKDVQEIVGVAVDFIKAHWQLIVAIILGPLGIVIGLVVKYWSKIKDFVTTAVSDIINFVKGHWVLLVAIIFGPIAIIVALIITHWAQIKEIFSAALAVVVSIVRTGWHAMYSATVSAIGSFIGFVQSIPGKIKAIFSGAAGWLLGAGKAIIEGLINGVKDMAGAAASAAAAVGHGIASAVKGVLGILSPSTVMRNIGQQIAAGLIKGLEGSASQVRSAASKLATDIKEAVTAKMITAGEGNTYTRWMERDNTKLQSLANKRKAILSEIKTAQKYAATTATNIENTDSVVSAAGTGPATAASILATLKVDLSQIKTFKTNINKLAKMGLNKTYLNQLIQAGPVDGGPVAAELAAGSWAQIKQINSVESQITSTAKKLGRDAADDMYDSGKNAGKGFLTGLQSQQKALENEMKKLAKALVKSIKHELGIASPSSVMRPHGRAVVDGLIIGIRDRMPQLDAAMKQVARSTGGALAAPGAGAGAIGSPTGVSTASQQQTLNLTLQMQWPTGEHLRKADQKYTLRYNKRNGVNGLTLATTTTA